MVMRPDSVLYQLCGVRGPDGAAGSLALRLRVEGLLHLGLDVEEGEVAVDQRADRLQDVVGLAPIER